MATVYCRSAGEFYQDSFYKYFRVRVDQTGLVDWSFGGSLQIGCSVDTTLYPFDRQRCGLLLENWAYSAEYVDLHNGSDRVQKDGYHESGTLSMSDLNWPLCHCSMTQPPPFRRTQVPDEKN